MSKGIITDHYPKYVVYEDGRIWSLSKNCFIRPAKNRDEYLVVNIISFSALDRYRHTIGLHRVVAKTFVDNPNNYPEVKHIDGNKENNHFSNLEWCTRSQNLSHKLGLKK